MNISQIYQTRLNSSQIYDELIKICENIAKNLEIPTEWIFICFFSKNWKINDFGNDFMKKRMYKPSETETSKIYAGLSSIKCNLCKRNKKVMIRNLCQHHYCWHCIENYILSHYSLKDEKKTLFPLCLFYEECSQMISHEIVTQILSNNEKLKKEYEKIVIEEFVKNQREKQS